MADASPEKAKDKPKKKKVTSSKDKEKVGTEQPEDKKPSKKEKTKSEPEPQQPSAVAEPAKAADGSRKASLAEGSQKHEATSRKASVPEPIVEASSIASNPDYDRIEKSSEEKFKPSYVPPPAATKRDVDLLTDLDEDKLLELKEAFALFDLDQDGVINAHDLRMTFQTLGDTNVRDDYVRAMLSEAISPLDFEAFVILLGYKTIEMDPEAVLIEALAQWDYDNSGLISEDRIKHDLMTWGDKFTKEEVEMALEDAPLYVNRRTGTGMIDYIKFCNTLSGLRKKTKMPGMEDFIKHK